MTSEGSDRSRAIEIGGRKGSGGWYCRSARVMKTLTQLGTLAGVSDADLVSICDRLRQQPEDPPHRRPHLREHVGLRRYSTFQVAMPASVSAAASGRMLAIDTPAGSILPSCDAQQPPWTTMATG